MAVDIKYVDTKFVQTYGAQPRRVPDEFADRMVKQGVARIINKPPEFNPSVVPAPKEEIVMVEHGYYTDVGIYYDRLEDHWKEVGLDCGFVFRSLSEGLLLSDIVIISSDLLIPQLDVRTEEHLKIVFSQKEMPFVFRVLDRMIETLWARQLLGRAALRVFPNKEVKKENQKVFGDLIKPYVIVDGPYEFWRRVAKVVGG